MALNDYRRGRKQVSFVVDEVLWGRVKAKAARHGVSVTAYVTELLESDLEVGHGGAAASGGGQSAASDVGGSRPVAVRGGEDPARVGAADVAGPVDLDSLVAEVFAGRSDAPALELVADPFDSDARPAGRDARGRLLVPVVRDEWIDTA